MMKKGAFRINFSMVVPIALLVVTVTVFAAVMAGTNGSAHGFRETGPGGAPDTVTDKDGNKYKAPDFTVIDESGNAVKLSELSGNGKGIVLNFWASWCAPCKNELPDLQMCYEKYGEKVEFALVNLTSTPKESVEKAKGYLSQKGYTVPCYFDVEGSAMEAYGIESVPLTLFIDADGKIVAYYDRRINYDTLKKGVEMLIGE